MIAQVDTGKAMLTLAYDRNGRAIAGRTRGDAQRVAKASLIFDPAQVWGAALARLLGTCADGVTVTRGDIADALKLCALKLQAGDKAFVMESLVGQAALLGRLMNEAASEYQATDRVDFKARRLANFLALQRAHTKVVGAIAAMQARAAH